MYFRPDGYCIELCRFEFSDPNAPWLLVATCLRFSDLPETGILKLITWFCNPKIARLPISGFVFKKSALKNITELLIAIQKIDRGFQN